MSIYLGVDPGSRKTGFGVIETRGSRSRYIASGTIQVSDLAFPERLKVIYQSLETVIGQYHPDAMIVEQVFLGKNASSALKLGQARGAAIAAGAVAGLTVHEYSARQIKQAVVGVGSSSKEQIQQMVKYLLKLDGLPKEDAADALAGALCHAHTHPELARNTSPVRRQTLQVKGSR